jgi:hypothetical protein
MLKNIFFALPFLIALVISNAIQAADQAPDEAVLAETIPAMPPEKEAVKQAVTNTRPINDNHVDYRYCLELKTNREISECRYKKK